MINTAIEDLFLREEEIENSATCNVVEKTATEVAALTYETATNGGVYKLTTDGTIDGTARTKGTFLKASIASTTLTWSVAEASDFKGYKESDVRDWKRWGRDHSKDLGIAAWLTGADKYTAGAATVVLESSADGATWHDVATAAGSVANVDAAGRLVFFLLPRTGLKQYVRVKVKVTTRFADASGYLAPNLTVGLENDADIDIDRVAVQSKL
ncbi:MAG: hypothetical protein J6W80_06080 [Kiritimatiellae bacterium]|nr:hypothetical protein [Kiritimatiellia bacterium]